MSDYRFDGRSAKKFKIDIKRNHAKEAEIAVRLCIAGHSKTGEWPSLVPSGIDATGEFIENIKDVNSDPDFKINDRPVEITRSDVVCQRSFHQKCHKIIKCLEGKTDLVFVNGYDVLENPGYLWLTKDNIEPFVTKSLTKYGEVLMRGGGKIGVLAKPAYRFDVYWFEQEGMWKPLPALDKVAKTVYKDIIKITKR